MLGPPHRPTTAEHQQRMRNRHISPSCRNQIKDGSQQSEATYGENWLFVRWRWEVAQPQEQGTPGIVSVLWIVERKAQHDLWKTRTGRG